MSILQADGIQFGNGTSINSKYFLIPQYDAGTPHEVFFYQSAAPTGWTKNTTHSNKALRVVTGNGRGTAGTSDFTTIFNLTNSAGLSGTFSGSVGSTTLTLQQIPQHSHGGGSSFTAISSPSSSPFRAANRQPRGYSFRASTRVQINNRAQINFRQPRVVRAANSNRVQRRYRVQVRNRQPRSYRQRRQFRSRNPFTLPAAYSVQVRVRQRRSFSVPVARPARNRNPFSVTVAQPRRSPARVSFRGPATISRRQPRRATYFFRQPRRQRRRRPRNRRSRRPFTVPAQRSVNVRRPITSSFRQPRTANQRRSFQRPFRQPRRQRRQQSVQQPLRQRIRVNQPRSYSVQVSLRQRRDTRSRADIPFRVRYDFRQRRSARYSQPNRISVNQRNPASYRQPRTYRAIQRYPATNNTRVELRTLTPGGTIRGANTQGPATSSVGGGMSHDHGFTGAEFTASISLSLRLQYIDVILCRFD